MTAVMTVTNNQSIREKPWTFCPVVMQIMHKTHRQYINNNQL